MAKLWETSADSPGSEIRKQVESFTVGNDYILDQELVPYDLMASRTHVHALEKAGILTSDESEKLEEGLDEIMNLWSSGQFEIRVEDEDVHTAIEEWLTKELGDLGKKIHTGRSRNDQVLTAVRLYEREELTLTLEQIQTTIGYLLQFGDKGLDIPMPGYTHTRKAMLSSVAQWAGGYAELLILQAEASDGILHLINQSPLGTAAGFGTSLDLDRDAEAEALGFEAPLSCATSAQLSRGWVELQLVQYLSGFSSVLNRLAHDIIQFSSEAFGFFELHEYVCTGSSIMPQKKNPDVAELIRGKHAYMEGYTAMLQGITRNLGSGYHRELQLTKEPVINAFGTIQEIVAATDLLLTNMSCNRERLLAACTSDLLQAEAAYKLVTREGWSFRDAYKHVKTGKESMDTGNIEGLLKDYSQIGSPGNPGLDRLKKRLGKL